MSIFMKIDGIEGNASDKNYIGWLTLISFSWRAQRKITSASSTRGDRESSNTAISDLSFNRYMDKATTDLFKAACCGKGSTIKLVKTKTGTGNGADPFIEYTLHNAIVSHYAVDADGDPGLIPREHLRLSFTAVEVRYTSYDDKGNIITSASQGFDAATNTRL
ncbi:MAG: hypothetical protein COC05_06925 [Gammaproteobacteria bacterium]|nr:MAG: hypothetical protein COC05_06925 [Gammaproteobacteria bacterium]